ncbi:MAG: glycosyltransferase, partial [Acidobacteria bacterium]|nr:glycosyltransferase [Acidobacteriota bacterium]
LKEFSACLVPFRVNAVTHATDPVKLYEYFALGKPVVATSLAELEHCRHLLSMGRDATDFADKLDAAMAENSPELTEARIRFAGENTWTHRVDTLEQAIGARTPLISILIVTYNSASYLEPCLDSIARNTSYANYEVVLVDNASRDETSRIAREFAGDDARIRFFALDRNDGFASANNFAAARARGELLVLLNADTMVTSGWLTRLRNHLAADPTVGLVCAVTNFSGNETKVAVNYSNQQEMEDGAMERATMHNRQSLEIAMAPLFGVMLRKQLFDELGGLDERFGTGMFEDDDFSMQVRRAGKRVIAA